MKKSVEARWANQRFGRLFIVNAWVDGGVTRANCVCDCGERGVYRVADMKSGNTNSCGCFRRENLSVIKSTHRATNTPLYGVWTDIKKRCLNPRHRFYSRYGGRGIGISDSWKSDFSSFKADMGDRPSPLHEIDRINNDGDYCKENCRWATRRENMRNTERAIIIEHEGRNIPLKDLSALTGIKYHTLYYRHKAGIRLLG